MQPLNSESLGNQPVLKIDQIVVAVMWEASPQPIAGSARLAVSQIIGKDQLVPRHSDYDSLEVTG
jgi:hypothetical protein